MKRLMIAVATLLLLLGLTAPKTSFAATSFEDVNEYEEEIDYLVEQEIINGFSDGTFQPEADIRRLQAVNMILRAKGITDLDAPDPGFSDLNPGDEGYAAIAKAVDLGIIDGREDNGEKYFDAFGTLTREQMAKILVQAYDLEGTYDKDFSDVPQDWSYDYINTLAANNITTGYSDGTFKPYVNLSRQHFVVFMARVLDDRFIDNDNDLDVPEIDTSDIMGYDEMVQALDTLEEHSDGKLEVSTLVDLGIEDGVSEAGRDLYVAKIGHGNKKIWVQGRIHGDEPYGTNTALRMIENLLNEKDDSYKQMMEELTMYFIPMYNPDGAENNDRRTTLMDENGEPKLNEDGKKITIDLNRDWLEDGFAASESLGFYKLWTDLQPDLMLDLHHQGHPKFPETDIPVTMSLGISLAPGGPTLPDLKDGEYDKVTRQMMGTIYNALQPYKEYTVDRYRVGRGGSAEIDIHGGLASAMMLGLNYDGLNPEQHSHPAVFLEASGQYRDGQPKPNIDGDQEPLIKQNMIATHALLANYASGELYETDPDLWYDIPAPALEGYSTDYDGTIPADQPAVKIDVSTSEILSIVKRYEEIDRFSDSAAANQLKSYLEALDHYETNGNIDKVKQSLTGLDTLLDYQHEHDLITDNSYEVLSAYSAYFADELQDNAE